MEKNDGRLQLRLPLNTIKVAKMKAIEKGYKGISEYILDLLMKDIQKEEK